MFKKCSCCGSYTDNDVKDCPFCGENHSDDGLIPLKELVSLIKKGEVSPLQVWTKRPIDLHDALKASL